MTVSAFIGADKEGYMYRIVDSSKQGYMHDEKGVIEADRNVIIPEYGPDDLDGFRIANKKTIILYVNLTYGAYRRKINRKLRKENDYE